MSAHEVSSHSKLGLHDIYPCYFPGETLVSKDRISMFALASSTPLDNDNFYPHLTDWVAEVKCFRFGVSQEVAELGLKPIC